MPIDSKRFDQVADAELRWLETAVGDCTSDDADVHLAQGVLTIALSDGQEIVVNSHRAAGQIWMAAFRRAWHFSPAETGGAWSWRTDRGDDLRATLGQLLTEWLGREVHL